MGDRETARLQTLDLPQIVEEMEDCAFRINANMSRLAGEEPTKLETQVQCKSHAFDLHTDLTNELNRNKSLVTLATEGLSLKETELRR